MTIKNRFFKDSIICLLGISALGAFAVSYPKYSTTSIIAHAQAAQSDVTLKHNSGIVTLTKPIRAYDSQDGNQQVTIPKGQTIHYRKAPEGVEIWNKKYPQNQNHHYVTVSSDESSLKTQANKDKNNNNRPKANGNIAEKNKKALAANKKKQAMINANKNKNKNKKNLPKTSDAHLSPTTYVIAATIIIAAGSILIFA